MQMLFTSALSVFANILTTLLSKKAVEFIAFKFLGWLAKRTDTAYDDELLKIIEEQYYGKEANTSTNN